MKKLSLYLIITILFNTASLFAQPEFICDEFTDYTIDHGDEETPGIYGVGDVSLGFDGDYQTLDIGIYGFFNNQQEDQTFFSINGSEPVSLVDIGFNTTVAGVQVVRGQYNLEYDVDLVYMSESNTDWNVRVYTFIGAIENITMTQFESGLIYTCGDEIAVVEDCIYDFEGNEGEGYVIDATIPFGFDGANQEVSFGYFDYYDWDELEGGGDTDHTFFSVNGSEPVDLGDIVGNTPYMIGDVIVTIDTTPLDDSYGVPENMHSGTVIFTGAIDFIVTSQVESGFKFICTESLSNTNDCIDYSEEGTSPMPGNFTLPFDGSNQEVAIGILNYYTWEAENNSGYITDYFTIAVNGSETITLTDVMFNQPLQVGGVTLSLDTTMLPPPYVYTFSNAHTGTIVATGEIESIDLSMSEVGLLYTCTAPAFTLPEDCIDYTLDGVPPVGGTLDLDLNGSDQTVSIGILGPLNWDDLGGWGSVGDCFTVTVNNSDEPLSLTYIYDNQPLNFNGVTYSIDTVSLNDQYELPWPTASTGTLILSGEIDNIELLMCESTALFMCSNESIEEVDCEDYMIDNEPQLNTSPSLIFDGSHQNISVGFWGYFDWDDITGSGSLADNCFFSVNNGPQISFETLYYSMPMTQDGITISLDTSLLNEDYNLADYLGAGALILSGEVQQIDFSFIEVAGLLYACKEMADPIICECNIDADFSYINLGTYYSFVSSGTGTAYAWDFGNGATSESENPTNYYDEPGTYEVCLTNYNLTDTCTITICQTVEVTIEEPGVHIISPNGDGIDDLEELSCNDVTVYDRNGRVVAELIDQQYWDGKDNNGVVLPMGEYVLRCNSNDAITKVTTIW